MNDYNIWYDDDMFDDIDNDAILEVFRDNIDEIKDAVPSMIKKSDACSYNPKVVICANKFSNWLKSNFKDEFEIKFEKDFVFNNLIMNAIFEDVWGTDGIGSLKDFVSHISYADSFSIAKRNDGKLEMQFEYHDLLIFMNKSD